MKATQIQQIITKAKAIGCQVLEVEGGRYDAFRITLPEGDAFTVSVDSDGKFKLAFLRYKNGGGTVVDCKFRSFMKFFEKTEAKAYPIVEEVEGDEPVVGTGGYLPRFTDIDPVTVVDVINDKKIIVRYDKATISENYKKVEHVGGFSAHVSNNRDQEWNIEQDVAGGLETYTLRKNGDWVQEGQSMENGQVLFLGKRIKFYDFNF
jgi:hypothetical protein